MKQQTTPRLSRKQWNFITALLCLACLALNLVLGDLAGRLGLPLYLDTVGSVISAILGGSLPAVLVGFTTNIIKGISDPSSLYYGVLNVLISVAAAWFAKLGWFKKPLGIAGATLIFTLIGGGLGALIPLFMNDLAFDSESLAGTLYATGFFGQTSAHLLASLLMDLLDKAASMVLILVIVKLIPVRYHRFFRFNGWMQTPLSAEEEDAAKKLSSRVMSLRTKILLALSVSLIAVSIAATGISVLLYRNALIKDRTKLAESTASVGARLIDPEQVDTFLTEGKDAPGYAEFDALLNDVLSSSSEITYLYVYQIREDGCHVVFDADTPDDAGYEPGEVIPIEESFMPYMGDLLAGNEVDPIITNDSFGLLLTAYCPVYDAAGNCVCYVGADVEMEQIYAVERNFVVEMLALFLGIFFLIFVFMSWLIDNHVILPINSIAMRAEKFAYNDEKARADSCEHISELDIHTGDEVENLYHSIVKTSNDSMRYVAHVQRSNAEMAQMQSALIMVLADIVESRDSNTGAHVRKTAAYADIILHEMRRKGYYADMLTDTYIDDVVHSAPLHDVGKIQVPDAILNKPGKLTDEEFEVMKKHTTTGQKIISEAISLVPHPGYLEEARNLATYHHEKWNGKGYPYGLAGEDIPLSARVMAVADVFDALVSKRSYKEPFAFEDAMQIIRDGSGSHFDPLIVDAFVGAEEQVRQVEERFSHMTDDSGCFSA